MDPIRARDRIGLLWMASATLAMAMVAGCGSDSDDDDDDPPPPPPIFPAAVAGDDFDVVTSAAGVTLDATKSSDQAGGPLTYSWSQTAGTPVTLSSTTASMPTFTAPAAEGTLTFVVTVSGAQATDSDAVNVNVKSLVVTAPDTWFVGY